MPMIPCKYLDYISEYTACSIHACTPPYPEVRYWLREPVWTDNGPGEAPNPAKVQFCRQRGRINGIFGCYNGEMPCYNPRKT